MVQASGRIVHETVKLSAWGAANEISSLAYRIKDPLKYPYLRSLPDHSFEMAVQPAGFCQDNPIPIRNSTSSNSLQTQGADAFSFMDVADIELIHIPSLFSNYDSQ